MEIKESLVRSIEQSIKDHWDLPALSDYQGVTYQYKDVARRIVKMHIMFEGCGIKRGDKIAICGRNSANWGTLFMSVVTYGAVAVPILHDFKPDNIHNIVNHSDSKLLLVGDVVWENLNEQRMPNLTAIIRITDFAVLYSKKRSIIALRDRLNEEFGKKFPKHFRPEHVSFFTENPDDLMLISYTSGTTGFSKGVMISYANVHSNVEFAFEVLPELLVGDKVVSMLPTAHMYGLMFEFIYEFLNGCHVHFLTRIPSPKIILNAFAEIKPRLIIAVPLIIEKIYRNNILPIISKPTMKALLALPVIDKTICNQILKKLNDTFGDNFIELIIGGAGLNQAVERFFRKIGFAYTVGYGMTECAPIITYSDRRETALYSCGKAVINMEIRIDSADQEHHVGEIQVRGKNVMMGYYKNDEATRNIFTPDGWMRTGDLGVIDKDGYVYIKGRSKNLILGASGQNIYPEEIEDKINNMPYVIESIVVDNHGKLVALVYPDFPKLEEDQKIAATEMEAMRVEINNLLPVYSQIVEVRIYPEEFEKTPKRSIKRFMYQV
ncbi:long-chain-fatty-acid--CoA ligase [Bacteroidia bacterium]|nr:long-chain-fatty-acid--CoA ligase [Bacteroidia bacterium]